MRRLFFALGFVILVSFTAVRLVRADDSPNAVRSTVDALHDATVAGDVDAVLSYYAPGAVVISPFGTFADAAAIRGFYEQFLAGNPGLAVEFTQRTMVFDTEVHRSLISSDTIKAAGVDRIVFIETIVVDDGRVASATILLDLADPATARFAQVLRGQ